MKRLIAINEHAALYGDNPTTDDKKLDAFKYLDELLSIRTANNLVAFLREYPRGLVETFSKERLIEESMYSNYDAGAFSFSKSAIEGAAKRYGIELLDALTDYGNYLDTHETHDKHLKELKRLTKRHEKARAAGDHEAMIKTLEEACNMGRLSSGSLFEKDLHELERLQTHLHALLRCAAAAHGIQGHGLAFATKEAKKDFLKVSLPFDALRCLPYLYYLHAKHEKAQVLEQYGFTITKAGVSSSIWNDYAPEQAFAGKLTAAALTLWLHWSEGAEEVLFSPSNGFKSTERHKSPIIRELIQIIQDARLGICPGCGKPFIAKQKPKEGKLRKTFCTDTCKVIHSTEGR